MTQKRKILFIIDSYSYMSVEPYQKNLIPAINSCDLIQPEYIEKDSFLRTSQTFSFDGVYCALKMRDSVKFATTIRSKINSATHIVFQDFDPWVFYDYTSAHYGGYKKIVNSIENISFHIPNEFWSNYIRNDLGCIVHTSHIGPSFTRFENVKPHSERLFKHPVFYGSSYGVREYAFATLRAHGINVDWRKEKVPHAEFTNLLNDVKIWLHYEGVPQNVTSDYSMDNEVVRHENLTQKYATWGDKLLQHADVLYSMQVDKVIKPITIQLAPVENCDSSCNFCSVSGRPLRARMKWSEIEQVLRDFKTLGAKSLEITGGGNPLLYKDIDTGKNINDIIRFANSLGYHIGIITNSEKLTKLSRDVYDMISWIRVSLIKLDEGKEPEDYDFAGFPYEKLGFSYIIYDKGPSPVTGRQYSGTSEYTIQRIARLVELHGGGIKFVRFAGNCLIKGNNSLVRKKLSDVIDANDKYKKFFFEND